MMYKNSMNNGSHFLSIGIMAHNEKDNISILLDKMLMQAENANYPFEITVVASGCTDSTDEIVRTYADQDRRVQLLIEKERKGKAEAINLFLSQAQGDLLIISSADIIPAEGVLESFLQELRENSVGMVGGRPIPQPHHGLTPSINSLFWELHHEMALKRPKLGELVALRNIIDKLPEGTINDDAALEAMITKKGYELKYLPEVNIYNYGPKTLASFIRQRTRIFVGHLYIKERMSYSVSTYSIFPLITLFFKKIKSDRKKTFLILLLAGLEIYSRMAAFYYFLTKNKKYLVWGR